MTDFEYRPYDHIFMMGFEYDGVEAEAFKGKLDIKLLIHNYAKIGPAWIGIYRAKCVGGCGLFMTSPGVAQSWMFFNKAAAPFSKTIVREIRKRTDEYMERFNFHRIHTFVPAYSETAVRFVKALGYENEGTLRMFGPGKEDYYVFAKLRG